MAKGWSFGALTAALKGAAFLDVGTVANTVAAGDDSRIVNALQKGSNLADVADRTAARNNLYAAFVNGDGSTDFYCRNNGNDTAAVNNQRLEFRLQTKANLNGDSNQVFYGSNSGNPTALANNQRLDYMLTFKADVNGNQYTSFNVGGATGAAHAVRLDQFQSGSNSNGAWTKFPGGGMYARANFSIPAKSSYNWYYPTTFPAAPAIMITALNGAPNVWVAGGVGANNVLIYNDNSAALNVNVLALW